MERREETDAAQDNQEHEGDRPRGPTKQVTGGVELASHVGPFHNTRFGRNGMLTRNRVNCRITTNACKEPVHFYAS
jgi:hypothetical protein